MLSSARISLFLAAVAFSACAEVSENTPLTFNASSEVKFQKSLWRIEAALTPEDKTALSKAIGALAAYPVDGNCDVANILRHVEQYADPSFKQKLRLRRLHGLTAEQVIDIAQEKNCNAEASAQTEAYELETAAAGARVQKHDGPLAAVNKIDSIILRADPYMLKDLTPRYASLNLNCMPSDGNITWEGPISISVVDAVTPPLTIGNGLAEAPKEEKYVLGRNYGRFWERGDVYFDDVRTDIPSRYKKIERKVDNGYGGFELRQERVLIGPNKAFNDVLLPKLKSSKTMRLDYRNGMGPTFELGDIKEKIEILETQCALKGAAP